MHQIVKSLFGLCYLLFLLAMLIVGLVFLTDQISGNKSSIPNFNNTMYNFLYVGLWIIVAITALQFVAGVVSIGLIVNTIIATPERIVEPDFELDPTMGAKRKSKRKLAKRANQKAL